MALIKCPDCKTQISDGADACPRCGSKEHKSVLWLIQMKKQRIAEIERMNQPAEGDPGAGCGWTTLIVSVALIIAGFAFRTGWICIVGCVVLAVGGICAFSQESSGRKAYDANVNRYNQDKASLPRLRRELAELEAKIR